MFFASLLPVCASLPSLSIQAQVSTSLSSQGVFVTLPWMYMEREGPHSQHLNIWTRKPLQDRQEKHEGMETMRLYRVVGRGTFLLGHWLNGSLVHGVGTSLSSMAFHLTQVRSTGLQAGKVPMLWLVLDWCVDFSVMRSGKGQPHKTPLECCTSWCWGGLPSWLTLFCSTWLGHTSQINSLQMGTDSFNHKHLYCVSKIISSTYCSLRESPDNSLCFHFSYFPYGWHYRKKHPPSHYHLLPQKSVPVFFPSLPHGRKVTQ